MIITKNKEQVQQTLSNFLIALNGSPEERSSEKNYKLSVLIPLAISS